MNLPAYFLIPLVAAAIYALSTMFTKRAFDEGMRLWQGVHLTNITVGILIFPLLAFESDPVKWPLIYQPLIMTACYCVANWFTVLAIQKGDVSLVMPIMGIKVVFVAIGAALILHEFLPPSLIFSAVLASAGIFVLGIPELIGGRHFKVTLGYTLLSSGLFATCDLMVQRWASGFGNLAFIAVASGGIALASILAILISHLTQTPFAWPRPPSRFWAWTGAWLVALQAILFAGSLTIFGDATGINVVYASGGLWAIVFVWLIGSRFGLRECAISGRMYICRVVGAMMLAVAICAAVMARSS